MFDFLTVGQDAHERETEKELTKHIQKFLLELGTGFAFLGSQYPIEVSGETYHVDLLFYHVKLHSYVAIELKAAKFSPSDVGQIGFYLTALDNQVKGPQDGPSIGLILCKSKDKVVGEYAIQSCSKPLGLAEYKMIGSIPEDLKTSLPTIEEIEKELSKV